MNPLKSTIKNLKRAELISELPSQLVLFLKGQSLKSPQLLALLELTSWNIYNMISILNSCPYEIEHTS